MEQYMIPCPFKVLFGFDCLGCGTQRALYLILNGNFSEAFSLYPPIYSLIPLLIVFILKYFVVKQKLDDVFKLLLYVNSIVLPTSYFIKNIL